MNSPSSFRFGSFFRGRILDLEHFDCLILRPRRKQLVVRRQIKRVDVLVMDLLSKQRFRPVDLGGGCVERRKIPHLDRSVLGGGEQELGFAGGGGLMVGWFPTESDGSYALGVTFTDGNTSPFTLVTFCR